MTISDVRTLCAILLGIGALGLGCGCSKTAPAPPATPPGAAVSPAPALSAGPAASATPGGAPAVSSRPAEAFQLGADVISWIGPGQLSGRTYTHPYFKLEVTVPEGWYIQSRAEAEELARIGFSTMNPAARAAMQATQQRMLTVLSIFRHPPGTPGVANSLMNVTIERVSHLPGIKRGSDYLELAKASMKQSSIESSFEPIETDVRIGSIPADRLKLRLEVGANQAMQQQMHAARVGEFMLLVIIGYADPDQQKEVEAVFTSLKASLPDAP